MKYQLTFLLLCFFLFSNAQTEVLDTEALRFLAMTSRDTVALRPLLSDDLVYIHSNGLQESKEAHLTSIRTGSIVYQKMTRKDVRVRKYKKMAITNGDVQVQGTLNNTPFEIHLLYTAVYRKHKKTWQLVNWQSTRLP